MTNSKIRVAILGFGLSGRYLQAPFFVTNPSFELATVLSTRQKEAVHFPNVQFTTDLNAILEDPTIQLVSICTPNPTHFDLAQKCLQAGKHVLIEKPITSTPEEIDQLVEWAQQQDLHIFAFQNRRFDSDFRTVEALLQQGMLGEVFKVEICYDRFRPEPNTKPWKEQQSPSTGLLYDLGPHGVDQALALFGPPEAYTGHKYRQRPGSEVDDAFDVLLDYTEVLVHLSAGLMAREPRPRFAVHGTRGTYYKYGQDVQEEQLKSGMLPGAPGFGIEPKEQSGYIVTEENGQTTKTRLESVPGDWNILFENIAEVLHGTAEPIISLEDVWTQIKILERI